MRQTRPPRDRSLVPAWLRRGMRPSLSRHPRFWGLVVSGWRAFLRLRAAFYHPGLVKRYLLTQQPRKLHLGCGPNVLPGWLNTDRNVGTDIVSLDVSKPLPFADCTFDFVFTEHMIEHLDFPSGQALIREVFRILKPGGKLRISTPNLQLLMDLYAAPTSELQQRYVSWTGETFLGGLTPCSATHVINNFFRAWGHQFIYDDQTLRDALLASRFVGLVRREVGESDDTELQGLESHASVIGDEFNRLESLVIEATRPPESDARPAASNGECGPAR